MTRLYIMAQTNLPQPYQCCCIIPSIYLLLFSLSLSMVALELQAEEGFKVSNQDVFPPQCTRTCCPC